MDPLRGCDHDDIVANLSHVGLRNYRHPSYERTFRTMIVHHGHYAMSAEDPRREQFLKIISRAVADNPLGGEFC